MTFEKWYEEGGEKSYRNLSLQEKQALECKFLDYLRRAYHDEVADLRKADQQNTSVYQCVAAWPKVRRQAPLGA